MSSRPGLAPRTPGAKRTETLRRLLDVASEQFLQQGFETASVSQIAGLARCSTATVYAEYGSKEGLFVAAMAQALQGEPLAWELGESGFSALMGYLCRRLVYLAAPTVPLQLRAVIVQPELTRESFSSAERALYEKNEAALSTLLSASVNEGCLRPLGRTILLSHCLAQEEQWVLRGLLHGVAQLPTAPHPTLYGLLRPLVTGLGLARLRAFLVAAGFDPQGLFPDDAE